MFAARVSYHIGLILAALACAMIGPLLTAMAAGEDYAVSAYLFFSGLTAFLAGVLMIASRGAAAGGDMKDAAALLAIAWFIIPLAAAGPFVVQGAALSDAYFEAVSALTTTGALIDPDAARLSFSGMMWRAELQWLGGFVTIVAAATIISQPDILGAVIPTPPAAMGEERSVLRTARQYAQRFFGVYVAFTFLAFISCMLSGATPYDAVILALSSIATGGLVPQSGGLASYSPGVVAAVAMFSLAGAVNFTLHLRAVTGRRLQYAEDRENIALVIGLLTLTALTALSSAGLQFSDVGKALLFSISTLTTSGFGLEDSSAPFALAMIAALIGGSALSTAGGLKLARLVVLFSSAKRELRRLNHPHGVSRDATTDARVGFGVWIYLVGYLLTLAAAMLTISLFGHDFNVSLAAASALLTNTGPLLNLAVEGEARYDMFSSELRILMAFVMSLGRLEAVAAFLFFHRAFWRN